MNIYIICSNDYPAGVVSREQRAKEIVAHRSNREKKRELESTPGNLQPRIYWKYYEFEIDEKPESLGRDYDI